MMEPAAKAPKSAISVDGYVISMKSACRRLDRMPADSDDS
jgi:hypothetical protein